MMTAIILLSIALFVSGFCTFTITVRSIKDQRFYEEKIEAYEKQLKAVIHDVNIQMENNRSLRKALMERDHIRNEESKKVNEDEVNNYTHEAIQTEDCEYEN